MDAQGLRVFIYDWIVAHGEPPSLGKIGAGFGVDAPEARRAVGARSAR